LTVLLRIEFERVMVWPLVPDHLPQIAQVDG
jgi:hypothetical protein